MYVTAPPVKLFRIMTHVKPLVYDIAWQGITNLTRNGPDQTVGATRTYIAPTVEGTLTFTEKVCSSATFYAWLSN